MKSNVLERPAASAALLDTDVTARPLHSYHLLQRVGMVDEETLLEPSAGIASQEEFCDLAYRHDVERDIATQLETGAITFDDAIRAGVFRKLLLYAQSYDVVGDGKPKEFADKICIGELHCPRIDGASAKWTTKSEHGDAIGLELSVKGIAGGGWSSGAAYCASSELATTHVRCLGLYLNIIGEYLLWKNLDNPNRYLVMTNIFSIGQAVSTDSVRDPLSDLCDKPEMYQIWSDDIARRRLIERKDFERFSVIEQGQPSKYIGTWKREREFNLSLGFDVGDGSTPLGRTGFSIKSRFLREISVETVCPAGHDYIGRYESPTALPLRWAVSP